MNYFNNLYTLIEIAINNGVEDRRLPILSRFLNEKNVYAIQKDYPELTKFIPYCRWYVIQDRNVMAMSAYIYDVYKKTGLLPSLEDYDINPDIEKLEHWQYINPLVFEINPESGFEFAEKYKKEIEKFINYGLIIYEDNSYRLSDKGRDISNSVLCEFV